MAELFDTKKYAEEWLNEYTNNIFDEGYFKGIDEAMETVKRFIRACDGVDNTPYATLHTLLLHDYEKLIDTINSIEDSKDFKPVYIAQLPQEAINDIERRITELEGWMPLTDEWKDEKIKDVVPLIEEAERDKLDDGIPWVDDDVFQRLLDEFCESQKERRAIYGYDY